ncbi:MAG: isopentenyl phosphate kinase [Candidatus Bathyarchaeia archaeon]|nr:isopentenyl phosphate kinase family protein [Candidatus Bathyarchaeota archaeon]
MKEEPLIIKLGGSLITNKNEDFSARKDIIDGISKEIAKINRKLIIVHGAGSFGHPIAKKYGLHLGFKNKKQLKGFIETKTSLHFLNKMIVDNLIKYNALALSFQPLTFITAVNGRIKQINIKPLLNALKLNFIPVLHGDIVFDEVLGFSIVSGDQIIAKLAPKVKADKVIFGCDVDGVFTADPKKDPQAKLIPIINSRNFKNIMNMVKQLEVADVTGGMKGKLVECLNLAKKGIESIIINLTKPENLTAFLNGYSISCTRFLSFNKK